MLNPCNSYLREYCLNKNHDIFLLNIIDRDYKQC